MVGTTQEETKEILLEHGLYGMMGFAVKADAPLGFGSFRTKPTNKKVSDWLTPSSFHFRDANNRKLTQEKLVKKLTQQSSLYDIHDTFIKQFFTGNEPGAQGGGGHAVAVLGWDDNYRNPKTDLTNKLIEDFQGRVEFISEKDKNLGTTLAKSLERFMEFLSANQIT